MEIKIFNKALELLDIAEQYNSITWKDKFYECGTFTLNFPMIPKNIELLQMTNMIYIGDHNAAVIETSIKSIAENKTESAQVGGRFIAKHLSQRENWGRVQETGITYELLMRKFVNESLINPTNTDRVMSNMLLGDLNNYSEVASYQDSYGGVLKIIEELAKSSGIGFFVRFDPKLRKMIFETRKGTDRTINQSLNNRVLFSRDLDNVITQTYTKSMADYANVALIGGSGEDEARKMTSIGTATGVDRYEMFVDAKDISDKVDTVEIPWGTYEPMLKQRGLEKLNENSKIKTFEGVFNLNGQNKYGVDFFLGDYVTVFDKKWGVAMDTQITEVAQIIEPLNTKTTLTFGNKIPTIFDKINRR